MGLVGASPQQAVLCDLTIAICTYNGAQRLPAVLDGLLQQTGTADVSWEVLVVDNHSTDETAAVVRRYQRQWPSTMPLRYCFEPNQGAAYARHRAIQSAHSELIGFLDDDNLPAHNWVAAAYRFAQRHPQVGAYGSQIQGKFDGPLPSDFNRIQSFFALTQRGETPHPYRSWKKVLPPSAGLVVRRQAWLHHVPEQLMLTGRHDNHMLTGEDLEAISYIQQSRWEVWHNPAMKLQHHIPQWRLQREYLLPFFRGIGLSRHVTRMLGVPVWQRPVMVGLYWVNDLRKLMWHLLQYRGRLRSNLVAACELQLFVSSLVSPFYILGTLWVDRRH